MLNGDALKRTMSVIVPALNEEANISSTYSEIMGFIKDEFEEYEILIFDDGSSDRTGEIADEIAAGNPCVRVIHNKENMGIGYNYFAGIGMARMNYSMLIPGDNEYLGSSIKRMFRYVGHADIITSYSINMESRPYTRRILSRLYTIMINAFFDLELNYYNGAVIHRNDIVRDVDVSTFSFAYQSLILTQLLKSGHTFIEVGVYLRQRHAGQSTALKIKNVMSVLSNVARHWVKIRFLEKQRYCRQARRIILDID